MLMMDWAALTQCNVFTSGRAVWPQSSEPHFPIFTYLQYWQLTVTGTQNMNPEDLVRDCMETQEINIMIVTIFVQNTTLDAILGGE